MSVSAKEFALAYNAASSQKEVAASLGLTPQAVQSRVAHYKKKNIRLKRMNGAGRSTLDVEEINSALAEQGLLPEDGNDVVFNEKTEVEGQAAKPKRVRKKKVA